MQFSKFESIVSPSRINRYLQASNGDTKKAMTLYRYNLHLSQEMFTIIGCFEVSLRNAIDNHFFKTLGSNWLKNSVQNNGIFNNKHCYFTTYSINEAIKNLKHNYTHNKLVAELGFGFWRYLFAQQQFNATGKNLLNIFPSKPTSSASNQYNNKYVFNQLAKINIARNRIAHHEPICFQSLFPTISTSEIREAYSIIMMFFQWLNIDSASYLYGLDHIKNICNKIDSK